MSVPSPEDYDRAASDLANVIERLNPDLNSAAKLMLLSVALDVCAGHLEHALKNIERMKGLAETVPSAEKRHKTT